jgi:hypothetical protein
MGNVFKNKSLFAIMIHIGLILTAVAILAVSQVGAKTVLSESPQALTLGSLSYQGTLLNSLGNPLTGSYEMTFSLYNSMDGASWLWQEVRSGGNAVPVQDGLFNVNLGSLAPIPVSVWDEIDLYLGVTIGNDAEMAPREKLTVVPSAAMAEVAQKALTVPDASITGTQIADGSIGLNDLGELPYYFYGSLATPTEWMADVIFNGNYARFCQAIGRTYSRAETLTAHYTEYPSAPRGKGNGFFYKDWYYVGQRVNDIDIHIYGNGDPIDYYNVWKYNGSQYAMTVLTWTFERSAIIWCK